MVFKPLLSVFDDNGVLLKDCPQAVKDFINLAQLDGKTVRRLEEQEKALTNYLSTVSTTITDDFLNFWKQGRGEVQSLKIAVRHTRNISGVLQFNFYIEEGAAQYLDQRSKGFLWFLAFYLRLASRTKTNHSQILLIDEPGSYLHARAQKDVLELFEKRIAQSRSIIYSTHSPFLMPADRLHRLRIIINKEEKGTLVLDRLTHPELRGGSVDTLAPIITAVGVDLHEALTFSKEGSVIVEGISDFIYLKNWAILFDQSFNEAVNIFPGTGSGTLATLASLLTAWGIQFALLVDRDRPTDLRKLQQGFLLANEQVVHPQGGEVIEDVFSREDFIKILTALDPEATISDADKRPGQIIKRLKLDKILLCRKFAEEVQKGNFTADETTSKRAKQLLDSISIAAKYAKENRI